MLHLFDTARGQIAPLNARDEGVVSIYVCGPTVYGPPHLGHGRSALVYDVLRRYLEWTGLAVRFVSNITDIDDKIIERGQREDRDPAEIAIKCESIWWQAMDAIGVRRPDVTPHATEYVQQMVDMIGALIDADKAYVTADGVYLTVEAVEGYGLLAHQSLEDMLVGGGEREVLGGADKRHPADFALWKFAKPGEPTWSSPWGDGRPGWHTECVAMALDILGDGFDLHSGGMDLQFPHHENERAQAVALGREFAAHWMHHAFVVDADGEKMSKSLGNFANLLDLIDTVDARAYRLLILQSHYRSPVSADRPTVDAAARALDRLDDFARRVVDVAAAHDASPDLLAAFRVRMDDDLDTPGVMALVFDAVRQANGALDRGEIADAGQLGAAVLQITAALGLELQSRLGDVPDEVQALVESRQRARDAKDFAESDRLRDELKALGWQVEDTASGPVARHLG